MTPDYTTMDRPRKAAYIDSAVCSWARDERTRFAELGLMLYDFELQLLYQEIADESGLPFRSFGSWLANRIPNTTPHEVPPARSTAYAALRARKELIDIPSVDYGQLPHGSIYSLRLTSTGLRSMPGVVDAAKKGAKPLLKHIQENHPDQHREKEVGVTFVLTETAKAEIDEAVELAIERGDSRTKEEWLLMVAIDYKQECENVGTLADTPDAKCGHA